MYSYQWQNGDGNIKFVFTFRFTINPLQVHSIKYSVFIGDLNP